MAYVSQEMKKELAPAIKSVLKKYGMKGTIAVNNHSTLVCNIKSGSLDLIGAADRYNQRQAERQGITYREVKDYLQVNPYWADKWSEEAGEKEIASFYRELFAAMKGPRYFDESDIMTDYFHCSHYIDINVGNWNKPYILVA